MTDNKETNRVYEVGYLVLPSIPEEKLEVIVTQLKKHVSDNSGEFISEEDPKSRRLAYQMEKRTEAGNERISSAYFGWLKFEMPAENAVALKEKLSGMPELLRFLIMKTVRESTYTPKMLPREEAEQEEVSSEGPSEESESQGSEPEEDLDKSIDALVTEE